jgi:hypothetical protein
MCRVTLLEKNWCKDSMNELKSKNIKQLKKNQRGFKSVYTWRRPLAKNFEGNVKIHYFKSLDSLFNLFRLWARADAIAVRIISRSWRLKLSLLTWPRNLTRFQNFFHLHLRIHLKHFVVNQYSELRINKTFSWWGFHVFCIFVCFCHLLNE